MRWYWIAALALVIIIGLASRRGERMSRMQHRLRPTGTSPSRDDIDTLLRAGQKIEAIKAYRILYRVDLKTAKDAMDARARDLGV